MVKNSIIHKILLNTDLDKDTAKFLVEEIINTIEVILKEGNHLKISRFGNFNVLHKNKRIGRNPKNQEVHEISERYVISFRASRYFKKEIMRHINAHASLEKFSAR